MNIDKGDIYGFVGANGAVKTMFMRLISSLVIPTSGEIYLFGNKNYKSELGKVGITIEAPSLYGNLTAKENLEVQMIQLGIKDKTKIEEYLKTVKMMDIDII